MNLKRFICISIVLHSLFCLSLLDFKGCTGNKGGGKGEEQSQTNSGGSNSDDKILEKEEKPAEVVIYKKADVNKAKPKPLDENCEPYFGGIGVEFNYQTATIDKVYKNYPAYYAGLSVGDVIISPDVDQVKGKVGTEVNLSFLRNGSTYSVTLIRARICLDRKME